MPGSEGTVDTQTESDEPEEESPAPSKAIGKAIGAFWNLSLIGDAWADLSKTDWFTASVRAYQMGIFTLFVWATFTTLLFAITYLTAPKAILRIIGRFATVGPLAPIGIYLFARFSRRILGELTEEPPEEASREDLIMLFTLSLLSFTLAAGVRMGFYTTYIELFGSNPTWTNIISMMMADGLYIGLLLMGIGSAAMLVFAPQSE